MVLFCFPLGSAHFNVSSVVAATHRATMFHDPIQTVEDTLTGCQVLGEMRKKRYKKREKMLKLQRKKSSTNQGHPRQNELPTKQKNDRALWHSHSKECKFDIKELNSLSIKTEYLSTLDSLPHTLHDAEQNGARSKIRGKSTWRFTFRKFIPALKHKNSQKNTTIRPAEWNAESLRIRVWKIKNTKAFEYLNAWQASGCLRPHLVETFQMQRDDRRQRGDQHLLSGTGVNLLHLLICTQHKCWSYLPCQ